MVPVCTPRRSSQIWRRLPTYVSHNLAVGDRTRATCCEAWTVSKHCMWIFSLSSPVTYAIACYLRHKSLELCWLGDDAHRHGSLHNHANYHTNWSFGCIPDDTRCRNGSTVLHLREYHPRRLLYQILDYLPVPSNGTTPNLRERLRCSLGHLRTCILPSLGRRH